jgi:glycine cleavage system transcriptional repressor
MSETHWLMLTVIGRDRPGIVARLSKALYEGGCSLGEASMIRLGGNFTIMLMVNYAASPSSLQHLLQEAARELGLRMHIDPIEGGLHQHLDPDVRITVCGADRPGIVAQVTGALAQAGLNILDLASDVAGSAARPIYIMHIEGQALRGIDALREALEPLARLGIEVSLAPVDTVIG